MRRYLTKEIFFSSWFFLVGVSVIFYDIYRKKSIAVAIQLEEATLEAFEAEFEGVTRPQPKAITMSESEHTWIELKARGQEYVAELKSKLGKDLAGQVVRQVRYFEAVEKGTKPLAVYLQENLVTKGCDRVLFYTSGMKKVELVLDEDKFVLKSPPVDLCKTTELYQGCVRKNFYYDAQQSSLHHNMIDKSTMILRHALDFQRDICSGDTFKFLCEKTYDKETGFVAQQTLLYTEVVLKNRKKISAYLIKLERGNEVYLDENSLPLRRSLLVTPVRGARISSHYGARRHPIRGYTRFHQGVDFAARTGTPVLASGEGRVLAIKHSKKGYGTHVILKHGKGYETLYAHLHQVATGLTQGTFVDQGAVIGYVGTSGESTGPHLHYEVREHGKRINPQSVNSLAPEKLTGAKWMKFSQQRQEIQRKLDLLKVE